MSIYEFKVRVRLDRIGSEGAQLSRRFCFKGFPFVS